MKIYNMLEFKENKIYLVLFNKKPYNFFIVRSKFSDQSKNKSYTGSVDSNFIETALDNFSELCRDYEEVWDYDAEILKDILWICSNFNKYLVKYKKYLTPKT